MKDQNKVVSEIQKMGSGIEKEINDIISNLDKIKDDENSKIVSLKGQMFTQCVNAVQGVTTVTVDTINALVKEYFAVLKKIATASPKTMKESYGGETGSIFESALSVL